MEMTDPKMALIEVAKKLGCSEETCNMIKKDLGMDTDSEDKEEDKTDSEEGKEMPEGKTVEVTVEKTSAPQGMAAVLAKLMTGKC